MIEETDWYPLAEQALFEALCAVFHLDPESSEARRRFLPAWHGGSALTRPADRYTDRCWYAISRRDTPRAGWLEFSAGPDSLTTRQVLALQAMLIFYGPHASEHADLARAGMLLDTGSGSPRAILRRYRMVPLSGAPAPRCLPEPDGTQWRQRADLDLTFHLLLERTTALPVIAEPPRVDIITELTERNPNHAVH